MSEIPQLPSHDHTFYGRHVSCYEDDGFVVAGHDRRAWAAANCKARQDYGRPVRKYITVTWALFYDTCGCTEDEHKLHGTVPPDDVDENDPRYEECYQHCEDVRHGLPPCDDIYGWMTEYVKESAVGAVPILAFHS